MMLELTIIFIIKIISISSSRDKKSDFDFWSKHSHRYANFGEILILGVLVESAQKRQVGRVQQGIEPEATDRLEDGAQRLNFGSWNFTPN